MTHNVQMAEQLTFSSNKAAAYEWHRSLHTKKNYPDENYARENMQLHQIGLQKLHEDGSPILDKFGNEIPNYTQEVSSWNLIASHATTYWLRECAAQEWNLTLLACLLLQIEYTLEHLRCLKNFHWSWTVISSWKLQWSWPLNYKLSWSDETE